MIQNPAIQGGGEGGTVQGTCDHIGMKGPYGNIIYSDGEKLHDNAFSPMTSGTMTVLKGSFVIIGFGGGSIEISGGIEKDQSLPSYYMVTDDFSVTVSD